jgi:hypothetical protein
MGSRRNRRIAKNQALFRTINEAVTRWPERQATPPWQKLIFYCECGDAKCYDRVYLTGPEYEAIRTDSARFVVVPGHVFPKAERVVEEHDGYSVVEMGEDVRGILEETDPRRVVTA